MKKFINVFFCSFLLIGSLIPLKVEAKELNGYSFSSGTVIELYLPSASNGTYRVKFTITSGSGVFYTYNFNNKNGVGYVCYSKEPFTFENISYDFNNNVISNNSGSGIYNSDLNLYRIRQTIFYSTYGDTRDAYCVPTSLGDFASENEALSVFNDYATNDLDFSYGRPANVGYNTRISGSGAAAANNIDRITWDSAVDHNGTKLPQNARVQIRAIPGQYTGTTKQDLLTKTYTNFVIDNTKAVQLVDIIASRGVYETKWSEVTAHFNLPFATFYSLIEGDSFWYRNGWIYQIRLQVDDYFSEWINIYTATGSGVTEAETITNSDNMTQQLIQQIQTINNLNETTTNWYISDTEINMEPYEEPGEGEKPWWAYLLEAITNLVDSVVKGITNIISSLADLAGDIIDGILSLFSFDSFEVDDWSTQQQQIKDNSGMFGQALDFTHSLQQTFEGVEYQEPILHFDGIELDNVTVIPEQTYNLNDYVESLGLTNFRNIAYLCTDGFIYFSLVLLIIRKLEGIFKK